MTPRQKALIDYHRDLAAFAATKPDDVFVILDLEDREGYAIAKEYDPKSAEKRDIIAEQGCYPAFTLTLPRDQANKLLDHGWPGAKHIPAAGKDMIPMMVVSDGRCMCLFIRNSSRS